MSIKQVGVLIVSLALLVVATKYLAPVEQEPPKPPAEDDVISLPDHCRAGDRYYVEAPRVPTLAAFECQQNGLWYQIPVPEIIRSTGVSKDTLTVTRPFLGLAR